MIEKKFDVDMTCVTCGITIEKSLKKKGIECKANPALKMVKVQFDESKHSTSEVIALIKDAGYNAKEK